MLKIRIVTLFLLISIIGFSLPLSSTAKNIEIQATTTQNSLKVSEEPKNYEYFEKIVGIILDPYISKEVELMHGKSVSWWSKINSVDMTEEVDDKGLHGIRYILKYEIYPYVGAHNSISVDRATISISWNGTIRVEKYEVIK